MVINAAVVGVVRIAAIVSVEEVGQLRRIHIALEVLFDVSRIWKEKNKFVNIILFCNFSNNITLNTVEYTM